MGKKDKSKKKLPKTQSAPTELPSSTRNVTLSSGKSASYKSVANHGTGSDTEDDLDSIPTMPQGRNKRNSKNDSLDEIQLEKKPSPVKAPLPRLTEEETTFFRKVEAGNLDTVGELLNAGNININKVNREGYTVLHLAVRRQDEPMVRLLLAQPDIEVYDTVLHAVREENIKLTKLLLEAYDKNEEEESQPPSKPPSPQTSGSTLASAPSGSGIRSSFKVKARGKKSPSGSKSKVPSPTSSGEMQDTDDVTFDSEFHSVITPLMLAATVGNATLMDIFYQRGERLETAQYPHNEKCECDICSKLEGDQDMTRAHQRFHLFKSITKPEYICFISKKEKMDPIKYSIDKIIKLRELNGKDDVFTKQYEDPEKKLHEFIAKMADLCRTSKEAEIFMSPKDSETEVLPHLYPRLWYAIGHDLNKLVSNQNVQNLVYKVWATDDWPEWDTYGVKMRTIQAVSRIIFPIGILYNFLSLKGKANGWSSPLSRFFNYLGCYFYFLAYLAFQNMFPYQRCNDEYPKYQIDDKHCKQRGPPNIGVEWVMLPFVLSFYLSFIKRQTVSWFWRMKWNWFELGMVVCLTMVLVCWAWAWLWTIIPENADLIFATERLMWPHNCPEILGECFLALSCLFAFIRALRFLQVFPVIGPLQVGIGNQVVAFLSSCCILLVFVFSAATGLLAIFVPYKGYEGVTEESKRKTQDESFTDVWPTLKNLLWHLNGRGEGHGVATLLKWDIGGSEENGTLELNEHTLTEITGTGIYCFFHFVASMIMWSMIAGYFAKAMSDVQEEVDMHWKCSRTELFLTFMKDTMLPPPFNLIPTIKTIKTIMSCKACKLMGRKEDPRCMCTLRQCCYFTQGKKRERWRKLMKCYKKLIVELMFRYSNFKEDENEEEKATRDDFAEIGEELDEIIAILGKLKQASNSSVDKDDDDSPSPSPPGGASRTGEELWEVPKSNLEFYGSDVFKQKSGAGSQASQNVSGAPSAASSKPVSVNPSSTKTVGMGMKIVNQFQTYSDNNNNIVMMAQTPEGHARNYFDIPPVAKVSDVGMMDFTGVSDVGKLDFTGGGLQKEESRRENRSEPNNNTPSNILLLAQTADGNAKNYFQISPEPTVSRVGLIDFSGSGDENRVVGNRRQSPPLPYPLHPPTAAMQPKTQTSPTAMRQQPIQQLSPMSTRSQQPIQQLSPLSTREQRSPSTMSQSPVQQLSPLSTREQRSPSTMSQPPVQQLSPLSTREQRSPSTMSQPLVQQFSPLSTREQKSATSMPPVMPPPPLAPSLDGDNESITQQGPAVVSPGDSRRLKTDTWNWAN